MLLTKLQACRQAFTVTGCVSLLLVSVRMPSERSENQVSQAIRGQARLDCSAWRNEQGCRMPQVFDL